MDDFETGAIVPGESPEQIKARITKLEADYASKKAVADKLNAWLLTCEEKINALKATMTDDNDHFGEEQMADLKKEMGTEGKGNEPTEDSDWGGEQMADLKSIVSGFKEGPDRRFQED